MVDIIRVLPSIVAVALVLDSSDQNDNQKLSTVDAGNNSAQTISQENWKFNLPENVRKFITQILKLKAFV